MFTSGHVFAWRAFRSGPAPSEVIDIFSGIQKKSLEKILIQTYTQSNEHFVDDSEEQYFVFTKNLND